MGIVSALEAWKAGYKDGYHDNGVHDDLYPHDADDYQNGWMEGEADRINSDPALLAAASRLAVLEAAFEESGGRGVEIAEEIDALRALLDPEVAAAATLSQDALVEAAAEAVALNEAPYEDIVREQALEDAAKYSEEPYPNAAFAEGVVSTFEGNLVPPPLPECWLWANGFAMSRTPDDKDVLAGYMDGDKEQAWECETLRSLAVAPVRPWCPVHD